MPHLPALRSAVAALCAMLPLAASATYNYSVIDLPGAVDTIASGINNAGRIVGWGDNGGCCAVAFYQDGAAAPVSYTVPGFVNLSEGWGVNSQGDIAGIYYDGQKLWGYVKSGNLFTQIDPGANNDIFATALNDAGQVVGSYSLDGGITTQAYVKTGGNYSTITLGDGSFTRASGIDNAGRVVGSFAVGFIGHGFLMQGAQVTVIDVPGAADSYVNGINNQGDLVGESYELSGAESGYLLRGGVFTPVNVPGATWTRPRAINDLGQIVGEFTDAQNITHGFLATPVPEPAPAALMFGGLGLLALRRRFRTPASAPAA